MSRLSERYSPDRLPLSRRHPRRRGRAVPPGQPPADRARPAGPGCTGSEPTWPSPTTSCCRIGRSCSGLWTTRVEPGIGGPYAERARQLLLAHAADLEKLTAAYDVLAARIAARPERFVVTHGEPHAGNVMLTPDGLVLIDWDTARLAPPERDLWTLAEADESLLDRYVRRDRPGTSTRTRCRSTGSGSTWPRSASTSGCSMARTSRAPTRRSPGPTCTTTCGPRSRWPELVRRRAL